MVRSASQWMQRLRSMFRIRASETSLYKRIFKNFSISLTGSLGLSLLNIAWIAILTKSLSIADYGYVIIVVNLFSTILAFLSFRVGDALFRFYPEFNLRKEERPISGLLFVSFLLSISVGIITSVSLYIFADDIARAWYDNADLARLFRLYAFVAPLSSLTGMNQALLRLKDRYLLITTHQIIGRVLRIVAVVVMFFVLGMKGITYAVAALLIGEVYTQGSLLISMLYVLKLRLFRATPIKALRSLKPFRKNLVSTFVQTNIMGYLRLFASPGDTFLVGIFSTPEQVAFYSIATTLTRMFNLYINNARTSITPEITTLYAEGRFRHLHKFFARQFVVGVLIAAPIFLAFVLFGKPVIALLSKPQYLSAYTVILVFILNYLSSFQFIGFYPLAMVMNKLGLRNLYMLGAVFATFLAIFTVGLNALTMALLGLLRTLGLNYGFNLPLYFQIRRMARASGKKG